MKYYLLIAAFLSVSIIVKAQPLVTFSERNYNSDSTRNAGEGVEFWNYGNTPADL